MIATRLLAGSSTRAEEGVQDAATTAELEAVDAAAPAESPIGMSDPAQPSEAAVDANADGAVQRSADAADGASSAPRPAWKRKAAMSATLEAAPIAAYLGGCPSLRSEGRRFNVAIEHLQQPELKRLQLLECRCSD